MEKTYQLLKLIIWVLLFAVLMAGAWVLYCNLSANVAPETVPSSTENAALAPDFTIYDADENPISLSDFRGKPVIVNFWASWCGPCQMEMPAFQTAFDTYGQQIHFVMVDMTDGYQETREKAQTLISDKGYTFPVYFDTDMDAAITYGVTAIPATYFVDGEGHMITSAKGAMSEEQLQQAIDLLLKNTEE